MSKAIKDYDYYCTKCGKRGIPILRQRGKEREAGHLKRLFCLTCQEETNHCECMEGTRYSHKDFLLEFKYDNFDEAGNRKEKYGKFKDKLVKEGVAY